MELRIPNLSPGLTAVNDNSETQVMTDDEIDRCIQSWRTADSLYDKYGLFFAPNWTLPVAWVALLLDK